MTPEQRRRNTAAALLLMGLGAAAWINSVSWGKWLVLAGSCP